MATIELKTCFANEPLFLEVIEAMYNLDNGKSEQDHRQAHHQALGYSVKDRRFGTLQMGNPSEHNHG
jgi:hypothetical protein